MQKMIPSLTERQRYWLEHIKACEAAGQSISQYAAAKGIAVQTMYAAKKTLVKKGALPRTLTARFQRVQVMQAAANNQWRIGLPNGVSVAFAGQTDAKTLATVLSVSAALD